MDEQAEASLKAHMRTITVKGQRLRIAIHAGDGTGTPLLLMAGIGSSLEMLQPFVDEVDPAIEVIRFDWPGTGGYRIPRACVSSHTLHIRGTHWAISINYGLR